MIINYLGQHVEGHHVFEVDERLYTFRFNEDKGTAISFRDASTKKIVARTYKSFRKFLGVAPGSKNASKLVQATQNYRIRGQR